MKKIRQFFGFPILLLVLIFLSNGCATMAGSWPAYHGKIVDAQTREPLEGVIVLAAWHGTSSSFAHSQSGCFHLESSRSDKNGEFVIPEWKDKEKKSRGIMDRYIKFHLYRPGYEYMTLFEETMIEMPVKMEKFSGTLDELFDKGSSIVRWTQCGGAGKYEKNKYQLLKTLYDELKNMEQTKSHSSNLYDIGEGAVRSLLSTDNFMSGGGLLSADQIKKILEENPL